MALRNIDIAGFRHYGDGTPYSVRIEFRPLTSSSIKLQQSQYSTKLHPWQKLLARQMKKARDISVEMLSGVIIGEIFARKVLFDQDLRQRGKRKSLCTTTKDYFTQKYGLRKMASEYVYALIYKLGTGWRSSKRFEVFGILTGIVRSEHYTTMSGDVISEFLSHLFGSADQIAAQFSRQYVYVQVSEVLTAAHHVFQLEAPETAKSKKKPVTPTPSDQNKPVSKEKSGTRGKKGGKGKENALQRSWTMPGALRGLLRERIELISQAADHIPELKGQGNVMYVDLDLAMEAVVLLFIQKVAIDRKMLMHLFVQFDLDGDGVLSFEEFENLLVQCQPSQKLNDSQILELWNLVNDAEDDDDGDSITKEGFAAVCICEGIQLNYSKLKNLKHQLHTLLSEVDYFTFSPQA